MADQYVWKLYFVYLILVVLLDKVDILDKMHNLKLATYNK